MRGDQETIRNKSLRYHILTVITGKVTTLAPTDSLQLRTNPSHLQEQCHTIGKKTQGTQNLIFLSIVTIQELLTQVTN